MSEGLELDREPRLVTVLRRCVVGLSVLVGAICLGVWARDSEALDGVMKAYLASQVGSGVLVATMIPIRLVTINRGAKDAAMARRLKRDCALLVAAAAGQAIAGFVLYPLTFVPEESPDPSWFGAVLGIALVGILGSGCAYVLLGLLGLVPAAAIVSRLPAAVRGSREARRTVVAASLLVLVLPLALALMLSGAEAPAVAGRGGFVAAVLALLGVGVENHGWLWVARGVVIACGLLIWVANRQEEADREAGLGDD